MSSNTPHTDDNSSTAVDEIDVPESSPSSPPAGWGLADRNWSSGWGPTSANGQNRESRISRSTNLRNLRADFSNAELTFEGRRERTTILDTLDTKLWASVQSYRCSDEARKGSTPYPTFTGPQVLQRLEEVQARLGAHIDEHSTLTRQMYETSNVLSALEAREKEVKEEIKALQTTQRELDALKEIAYARLFEEVAIVELSGTGHVMCSKILKRVPSSFISSLSNIAISLISICQHLTMSEHHQAQGRRKFDVSLAKLSRPGTQFHHFKTYKPPDMLANMTQEAQTDTKIMLTPQQESRKCYEERNLEQRRKKARERMAKRRAQDREREREKQKKYEEIYRQRHREERRYEEDRRRSLLRKIIDWAQDSRVIAGGGVVKDHLGLSTGNRNEWAQPTSPEYGSSEDAIHRKYGSLEFVCLVEPENARYCDEKGGESSAVEFQGEEKASKEYHQETQEDGDDMRDSSAAIRLRP
ncbi:hypothetical protein F5880DRAFT_1508525 [Lentinula raphanica]|nr:hypothetical protein F5880DRAFT_1508525 [Lentinula raphanica]